MNEGKKTDIPGQIEIADEVICIIAGTAAMEVNGVEAAAGAPKNNAFVEFFGKKNQPKGVKIEIDGNDAAVAIDIAVRYGVKLDTTAAEVQEKVKNAIETMTGLNVVSVNVTVTAVTPCKSSEEKNEA